MLAGGRDGILAGWFFGYGGNRNVLGTCGAAIYRAMGSLAFVVAARSAWMIVKDGQQPSRRLFLPMKNNLGSDGADMAYTIEPRGRWPRGRHLLVGCRSVRASFMSELTKRCDICHRATVCWPQTFTVIGPRDLCGTCFWRYRSLIEELAAFFDPIIAPRR